MLKNEINLNEILELKWEIISTKLNVFYTKCHYFLLPLLSINDKPSVEFQRHYVNTFIDDELRPLNIKNCILVLFKTTDINTNEESLTWEKLYQTLINNNDYVYHYYVGNNSVRNNVIFVFRIPEKYNTDLTILYDNKYSKISSYMKKRIIHFYRYQDNERNVLNGILYKLEWFRVAISKILDIEVMKNQEYWDNFLSTREIFRWKIN